MKQTSKIVEKDNLDPRFTSVSTQRHSSGWPPGGQWTTVDPSAILIWRNSKHDRKVDIMQPQDISSIFQESRKS